MGIAIVYKPFFLISKVVVACLVSNWQLIRNTSHIGKIFGNSESQITTPGSATRLDLREDKACQGLAGDERAG